MRSITLAGGLFIVFVMFFGMPADVHAHCDTLEGPVIKDAKMALENKNITPVLKWVSKEHEEEVKAAFDNTLNMRAADQDKADMKFFETLVRIHREGEGAPFSGIKPAGTPPEPAVVAADAAIEKGSADHLLEELTGAVSQEIRKRFDRVIATGKHKDDSIDAGRKYVAAYVDFVHYVEALHNSISAGGAHHYEETSGEDSHLKGPKH